MKASDPLMTVNDRQERAMASVADIALALRGASTETEGDCEGGEP